MGTVFLVILIREQARMAITTLATIEVTLFLMRVNMEVLTTIIIPIIHAGREATVQILYRSVYMKVAFDALQTGTV